MEGGGGGPEGLIYSVLAEEQTITQDMEIRHVALGLGEKIPALGSADRLR